METLLAIILIVIAYCACKSTEWRSNNRTCPPGYRTDWNKASLDITLHGVDYYHKQHLAGKYDVKIKNEKIGI